MLFFYKLAQSQFKDKFQNYEEIFPLINLAPGVQTLDSCLLNHVVPIIAKKGWTHAFSLQDEQECGRY